MQFNEERTQQIIGLIGKHLSVKLNASEAADLEQWVLENEENKQLLEELIDPSYRHRELHKMLNYTDTDVALAGFMAKRNAELVRDKSVPRLRKIFFNRRFAATAAAAAAITLGVWLYYTPYNAIVNRHSTIVNQNDISPGKNIATLTLASGEVINLSDAKTGVVIDASSVKYNDGSSVLSSGTDAKGPDPSKPGTTKDLGTTNIVQTPRGGTYQVILGDGTKVWLNADSKLEFSSNLGQQNQRNVKISGEAYFEVAKDKAHPFVVATDNQQVEVLGTHFNINAYPNEAAVKTTLLEGSVAVTANNRRAFLKPGQQSAVDKKGIQVSKVDLDEAMAWQKGYFRFYDEDIASVMRKVARWYNIDVKYSGALPEVGFNARISKYRNISDVLEVLEKSNAVHFKLEGRSVIVSK